MEKTFEEFIDLDKPIGKMFITGKEGSGKTLLSAYIGVEQMLRGLQDCWKSYDSVKEYNDLGYDFETNYEHLCVSNFDINCSGTKQPLQKAYVVNPYKVGLWSEEYDTDFFPPGTCFHFTEAHQVFNSHRWMFVRPEVKNFWTTARQAKYNGVFDTNRPNEVISDIRELCTRFLYLYKKLDDIYKDGILVGHRLYVREFEGWEQFLSSQKSKNSCNFEEYTLVLKRNTRPNYDSYFCKYLHLKGRFGQQFRMEHFPEIKTVDDVENFGDIFGLSPPEGYYVKPSKYTEINKVDEKSQEDLSDEDSFEFSN